MTILTSAPIVEIAPAFIAILAITAFFASVLLISLMTEAKVGFIISSIGLVVCIICMIFTPASHETGQWKYTVRITDDSEYKELVDGGYKCSQLFPGETIYEIIGNVLE